MFGKVILILSAVAIFVVIGIFDYKIRNIKERYAWRCSCRTMLKSISARFRWDCEEIMDSLFSDHKKDLAVDKGENVYDLYSISHICQTKISDIEEKYKKDLFEKIKDINEFRRVLPEQIPNDLVEEYMRDVSDIAQTFRSFCLLIKKRVTDRQNKVFALRDQIIEDMKNEQR